MFKNLAAALIALFVVLQIPLEEWRKASETKRDEIRQKATDSFMKKLGPGSMARIWEDIFDGNWRLHIEPTDSIVPTQNKIET